MERSYWVVSPNVRNNERTVDGWRQASVLASAAFIGYKPNDDNYKRMGARFAGTLKSGERQVTAGDIILIARRHHHMSQIVGFGIVRGSYSSSITGIKTPQPFGSLRKLSPFISLSGAVKDVPFIEVLGHTSALRRIDPTKKAQKEVCDWMETQLKSKPPPLSPVDLHEVNPPGNHQLDYIVRTKSETIIATNKEAALIRDYRQWLKLQKRTLPSLKYKALQCDGYEKDRRNLIEAKSSISREHIRMAVGQLLDYGYQGEHKLGASNMAILLPEKPASSVVEWLDPLKISLVWQEKGKFLDNANGQFA